MPRDSRRRLQGLTDDELITTGKTVSPGGIHWEDPKTIAENTRKYELCKEEWRRRHPNTGRKFCSDGRRPRSLASTDQKDQTRGLEVAEQADKNDEWDRDA
jgi:hypothetical protein